MNNQSLLTNYLSIKLERLHEEIIEQLDHKENCDIILIARQMIDNKRREDSIAKFKQLFDIPFSICPVNDMYLITPDGRVWSCKTNKFLKPSTTNDGYKYVAMDKIRYLIHRLVAMTFIENEGELPEVNHINKVRDDNRVENLEWCTVRKNRQDRIIPKRYKQYNQIIFNI